jgi:hypothetical protein
MPTLAELEARKHLSLPMVEKYAQMWRKERDPSVLMVLSDWLHEQGLDAPLIIEQLKLFDDQRIRRENMEEVAREQGNLEYEPWPIQPLSMEVPLEPRVDVIVDSLKQGPDDFGQARLTVEVPAERPARIVDVMHRTNRGDPSFPPGSYGRDPPWRWLIDYPFPIDEAAVIRQAVAKAGNQQAPWVGLEGEHFSPAGEPYETWLYMEYAPEYLQGELEREYGYDAEFITRYTDAGGFQSDADLAFVNEKTGTLYQLVRDGAHGAVECPYKDWNPEEREDERNRRVTVEDTFYGEHPHESCRFCEAAIGEEHGYLGEGGEFVYMRVPDEEEFTATHEWTVDGIVIPVVVGGGEVYDRPHAQAYRRGLPGIATVEVSDYDADGNEELVIRVGGQIRGRIRSI